MSFGFSTPLLDLFHRGDVERDVRLLAASGVIAPRAGEQLALLMLLVGDPDAEVAATAQRTLAGIPLEPLTRFLARSDAPEEVKAFFAARGVQPAAEPATGDDAPLVEVSEEPVEESDDKRKTPTLVALLPILDRLKLAMRGTREQRAVLIRDPHKLVALGVLSSPKVTTNEVENFARMGNVSEEVLRVIGRSRAWMKNYGVMSALARNPKTPPALSLRLVAHLNKRDIRMLSMDRSIPEALRLSARKFMAASQRE